MESEEVISRRKLLNKIDGFKINFFSVINAKLEFEMVFTRRVLHLDMIIKSI